MTTMFEKLKAPFPPDKISWRVGAVSKDKTKAMALAYIDARDVMERLDEVCGFENWQCRYPHANGKTVCEIGINIKPNSAIMKPDNTFEFKDNWIWKADGAGDSDIEAEKGALSDAFKRAAVRWGIGRYLYDMKSPWVRLDEYKKIVPEDMKMLGKLMPKSDSPQVVETDDSKELFFKQISDTIEQAKDGTILLTWWNSEEQKQARKDFGLSQTEADHYKSEVVKKRDMLRKAA